MNTIVEGEHFIPEKGPVILVSNHISYIDAVSLSYVAMRRRRVVHFLAKDGLFKNKVLASYLNACGQIPVARDTANAGDSLKEAVKYLNREHCVGIFPEATMPDDLVQLPIKSGAVRLSTQTCSPIVVVGAWGGHELFRKGSAPKLKFRVKHVMVVTPPYLVDENLSVDEAKAELANKMLDATMRAKQKRGK